MLQEEKSDQAAAIYSKCTPPVSNLLGAAAGVFIVWLLEARGEGGGEIFWWRVLGASLCKGALTPLSRRSTSNCRLTSELSLALPSPQNTTSKLKTTKEMW